MTRVIKSPQNPPKVSIILLNWNGWRDTIECLESLYQITYPNYDVIVVDNGSEDDSIEKIKEYCEGKIEVESKFFEYDTSNKPIKIIEYTREKAEAGEGKEKEIAGLPSNKKLILIKNEKNYGFAEGNNIGMRYAMKALSPDYILLLNNDTVVDRRFLDELVKVAESDEKIGIVGPKIYWYTKPDRIFSSGGILNQWTCNNRPSKADFDTVRDFDYVSGCALMIKIGKIRWDGLLPTEYFLMMEEINLCSRVRKKGFRIVVSPKSKVYHKIHASATSRIREFYNARNKVLFMKKFSSPIRYAFFLLWRFTIYFIHRAVISIFFQKNPNILKYYLKGTLNGIIFANKNNWRNNK